MDYRKYLTDDILEFWLKDSIDTEYGGIMNQVDKYGNVTSDEKNAWFIGRALWTYSMAYRLIDKNEKYLSVCENLFNFFEKCTLENNRLPHLMTKEGVAKTIRPVYYYSEMFAAMGCAQYYRICKKNEVLKKAEAFFDTVYNLYQENQHTTQEIGVEWECRTFGLHMAMLATTQFVRNMGMKTDKYNKIIDDIISEMKNGGYVSDEKKCVLEHISMDRHPLPGDFGAISCPGHIYEAAWFVLCEAEYRDNDEYRKFGKRLCIYAMPEGYNKETIFIPTLRNIETAPFGNKDEPYIWWPQCEAIITYHLLYNIYSDKTYTELAEKLEKETFDAFADSKDGEWYCAVDDNKKPTGENKGSIIKGPFHLPRMLFALISLKETGSILSYIK